MDGDLILRVYTLTASVLAEISVHLGTCTTVFDSKISSSNASESRVLDLGLDRPLAHDMETAGSKGHDLKTKVLERATFPRVLLRDSEVINVPVWITAES